MKDLSDDKLKQLRPNPKIDRASETVFRSDLNALLDEVERRRAAAAPELSPEDRRILENLRDADGRTTARERAVLIQLLGGCK